MPAHLPPGDSLAIIRKPTGPAREQALTSALERFGAGRSIAPADNPDGWVTTVRTLPAIDARYAPWPELVDARLRSALEARGISQLYTHQAAALTHALGGDNVVVTTPTASGKTLCYNAPVLSTILSDPAARAIYLFPTKALAQDQLAELHELTTHVNEAAGTDIGVFTYDGDTPQDARRAIRTRAHIVLSNPDMLHSGILPHHPKWAKLFENLRFVVVDELHAYRGVFGSHLANVLRRVQRVCRHYGSDPVFICSSATIANPRELAERLVEKTFTLIDASGAPRGEKLFLFVNPPVVNKELGIRRSYLDRSQARGGGVPQAAAAADRVLPEPAVDRDPDDVSEGRLRRPAGDTGSDSRIPRRLPPAAPARDRARAARGAGPRGRRRPTRSSSASTSARSTSPSWRGIPGRSPPPGSARAGQAGARGGLPR